MTIFTLLYWKYIIHFIVINLKIYTQSFYYSSSKFSKFIQGKSPFLQYLASVSLLKGKPKICPKLNFSPGMSRPFMFAALCYDAHLLKHSLAESKKQRKNLRYPKNSLAGSLVSRGITVVRNDEKAKRKNISVGRSFVRVITLFYDRRRQGISRKRTLSSDIFPNVSLEFCLPNWGVVPFDRKCS